MSFRGAARGKRAGVCVCSCVSVSGRSDCTRACVWQRRGKVSAIARTPAGWGLGGGEEPAKGGGECALWGSGGVGVGGEGTPLGAGLPA